MEEPEIITQEMKQALGTLAKVNEDDYKFTPRGVEFFFENSLRANRCKVIKYHNQVIVEFRKITNNPLEGKQDILLSERIINPDELMDHFETETGIYLNYIEWK